MLSSLWRRFSQTITDDKKCGHDTYLPLVQDNESNSSLANRYSRRHGQRFNLFLRIITLRRILLSVATVFSLLVLGIIVSGVPPTYEDIRAFERKLPQHNLTRAMEENTSYLRFQDHLWGHGLNNILQEAILLSYISARTNRSFVFEDYVWSHLPFPYTVHDFALRPVRIPLNAFIAGPTAGGPVSEHPPAISAEFWEAICPPERRRVVRPQGVPGRGARANEIVGFWEAKLRDIKDTCVSIESARTGERIFNFEFFNGDKIISLWPGLSRHPILTDFQWSPLVHSTLLRNFAFLQPAATRSLYDNATFTGLVAIHLRRGDYKRHCPRLAVWSARYNGLNASPDLPDRFDPSQHMETRNAYNTYYMQHCLPNVEQIVEKLRAVREQHPMLRRVYVLTNDWGWWLNRLKVALQKDGWDDFGSSLDLQLDLAQKHIAMAVDMAIAEKAEVFVGNGFSSLSSNVVMLRMAKGLNISSNRFL